MVIGIFLKSWLDTVAQWAGEARCGDMGQGFDSFLCFVAENPVCVGLGKMFEGTPKRKEGNSILLNTLYLENPGKAHRKLD